MWKYVSGAGAGNPLLNSICSFAGRQTWVYEHDAGTPEQRDAVEAARHHFTANRRIQRHSNDSLLRLQCQPKLANLPPFKKPDVNASDPSALPLGVVEESLRGGINFYSTLQSEDGHWPGDYGGPMFLMPGMIITCYVTGTMDEVLPGPHRAEMVRYLLNHQNADGGWGLHIEGGSTMFGSVLSYVSLRLLGLSAAAPELVAARKWMHPRGGATHITSWGKFWLCVLGVFDWSGVNPMPPEMWLLPYWLPLHPGRMWCHCRMVYLPMSYIYGARVAHPVDDLTASLRTELFVQPYDRVDWDAARNQCAAEDLYYPHPALQDVLWWALHRIDPWLLGTGLRARALAEALDHVLYEDTNTRHVDIGPVNKVINMLVCWHAKGADSDEFRRHIPRLQDYLWVAEDGMKMQGYNGSQLWDTAFAVQAIDAAGPARCGAVAAGPTLRRAHTYLHASQVLEDSAGGAVGLKKYYKHISKGAWPFSTRDHGWPISDCSAEGLKAALVLAGRSDAGPAIEPSRLCDCVNVILSYQNPAIGRLPGGGWATYENTRSWPALELVNPAETFGDIVIDYPYVECSAAAVTALVAFRAAHPDHRGAEIDVSVALGKRFLLDIQRDDGSWYGSWGVCFTYGTWFGVEGLVAAGEDPLTSPAVARAAAFLLARQRGDGGWGESYLSCETKTYSQLPAGEPSHVVCTAWALLTLITAGVAARDAAPLHRAARCLAASQLADGDWPQQHISGVFNRNCMITYANYRNIFPVWALGRYRTHVLGATD